MVEVEVQDDGSFVAFGSRDWQQALRDAASIRLAGSVSDQDVTFDVYAITHRDGIERHYALPT